MNSNEPAALLTVDDVAAICRVSVSTVRRWIYLGHLPAANLSPGRRNGCVRVRTANLAALIEGGLGKAGEFASYQCAQTLDTLESGSNRCQPMCSAPLDTSET